MSRVNDTGSDSDDNKGEWPHTTASTVPPLAASSTISLPRSSKRLREKQELVADADEVEARARPPPKKRRRAGGVVVKKSKASAKNTRIDAAGTCAQILKGLRATCTEQDVDDSDEDSEQTTRSRDEGSAKKPSSQKRLTTSKAPPRASRGKCKVTAWEDRLSELADYCQENGHCNVPRGYSKNTKLPMWVARQRLDYRLHVKGKASPMTTNRIQELKRLGFEWGSHGAAWEGRFSELADYCKENGHCNVPRGYTDNPKLAKWIGTQRSNFGLHLDGRKSPMTTFRIKELESLGFDWGFTATAWEDRLSALAEYRKIHGHCNVPDSYCGDMNLGKWVANQRNNCRMLLDGKKSAMTTFRFQELKGLGFELDSHGKSWEDRLNELADYRTIHGHCNVPQRYKENVMLATWVTTQRRNYRLQLEGKSSPMTPFRIQALERLDFEWKPTFSHSRRGVGVPKRPSVNDGTTRVRERVVKPPTHIHTQQHSLAKTTVVKKSAAIESTSLSKLKSPTGMAKSASSSSRVEPQTISVEAGDAGFEESDLDDSHSEIATKPSRYSDRQAADSLLSLDSRLETAPFNGMFRATGYH
jgi:hypothetical protein